MKHCVAPESTIAGSPMGLTEFFQDKLTGRLSRGSGCKVEMVNRRWFGADPSAVSFFTGGGCRLPKTLQ